MTQLAPNPAGTRTRRSPDTARDHVLPRPARSAAQARREEVDLRALHGLRIVLTAWLVVHHTVRWLLRDSGIDPDTVALLRQGQGATTGFFILSGVVLTWRYAERMGADPSIPRAANFFRRRWAAVWPLGTVGALVAVPYELVEDRLAPGEFVVGLFANIALVQSFFPVGGGIHGMTLRFDGPTWTLSTLLALYAAFPVLVWLVRRHVRTRVHLAVLAFAPWLVVTAAAWALRGEPNAVWMLHVHPLVRVADFLAGIAIGTWLLRYGPGSVRVMRWAQVLGLALVAGCVWLAVAADLQREVRFGALYIPAIAVLVYGLCTPTGVLGRVLATRPMQYAGKRAFALAMLHTPLLGLGWHFGIVRLEEPLGVAGVLCASGLLALCVHRWVEVPMRTRLRPAAPLGAQRSALG